MQILEQGKISGMVPYIKAYEIPAFVVMDYIHGPNLKQASEMGAFRSWATILDVGRNLASIIHAAHMVPKRVLHRDLRPSNVMLKGYYEDDSQYEVVVLDFDLSWHKDATEMSIVRPSSITGYIAPEQMRPQGNASTKNAAVDSYGLGMTLYFLRTNKDPIPHQHQHTNWECETVDEIRNHFCSEWSSLPHRYARLILNSTKHIQAQRWDVGTIQAELDRIRNAFRDPNRVSSAELLAEEVVARSSYSERYEWNQDELSATVNLASGVQLKVCGQEANESIECKIEWARRECGEKNISKYIGQATEQVVSILKGVSWRLEHRQSSADIISLRFVRRLKINNKELNDLSEGIGNALDKLCFKRLFQNLLK